MIPVFPTEREAKRQVLLEAVDEVRDVLAAGADEAEDLATLPKPTVEALYESGLLSLKLPAERGASGPRRHHRVGAVQSARVHIWQLAGDALRLPAGPWGG